MKLLAITHSVLPSGQIVGYKQALTEPRPMTINQWFRFIYKQTKKKSA